MESVQASCVEPGPRLTFGVEPLQQHVHRRGVQVAALDGTRGIQVGLSVLAVVHRPPLRVRLRARPVGFDDLAHAAVEGVGVKAHLLRGRADGRVAVGDGRQAVTVIPGVLATRVPAFSSRRVRFPSARAHPGWSDHWAFVRLVEPHLARVVVSNPMKTRGIAEANVKTDKVDARVLAQLLRCDYLPSVWTPSVAIEESRALAARWTALVGQRTAVRNRIHAVLARRLIRTPATGLFSPMGLAWLRTVELEPLDRDLVDADLTLFGRREIDPRRKQSGRPGTGRRNRRPEECLVLIRDRLPAESPGIGFPPTRTGWRPIGQRTIGPGAPRQGASFLAGLLRCGRCGRGMFARTRGRGTGTSTAAREARTTTPGRSARASPGRCSQSRPDRERQ